MNKHHCSCQCFVLHSTIYSLCWPRCSYIHCPRIVQAWVYYMLHVFVGVECCPHQIHQTAHRPHLQSIHRSVSWLVQSHLCVSIAAFLHPWHKCPIVACVAILVTLSPIHTMSHPSYLFLLCLSYVHTWYMVFSSSMGADVQMVVNHSHLQYKQQLCIGTIQAKLKWDNLFNMPFLYYQVQCDGFMSSLKEDNLGLHTTCTCLDHCNISTPHLRSCLLLKQNHHSSLSCIKLQQHFIWTYVSLPNAFANHVHCHQGPT